jgi:integrase/recombinase XerC
MFLTIIGDSEIESIKVYPIRKFLKALADKNYSKRAMARKIACLKSYFKFCVINEILETNPMDKIQNPKVRSENLLPKFLELQETIDFLDFIKSGKFLGSAARKRLYPIIRLMYAIMARISEICNIKNQDINFDNNTVILFGKGGKQRMVPFDDDTALILKEMIYNRALETSNGIQKSINLPKNNIISDYLRQNTNEHLFITSGGNKMNPRLIQTDIANIRQNFSGTGKKITAHVFRHTGATHLRQNGMDLSELQDLLGHASPNTTRIYARNDMTVLKKSYDGKHPLSNRD